MVPVSNSGPLRIAAYFPVICTGAGHSHACLNLCEHMQAPTVEVRLFVPSATPSGRRGFTRAALPAPLDRLAFKLSADGSLASMMQRASYRRALKTADVAYLWAATPLSIYEDVKDAGVPLFIERINCHRATSIPILDEAYRHAGLIPTHGITAASLSEERRKVAMADWIFAPSPLVKQSLVDDGVPEQKVLSSSYGWDPKQMAVRTRADPVVREPTFLFVGTGSIRKGAHLLLRAWADAKIRGRLVVVGPVLPEVVEAAGRSLEAPGVERLGYLDDLARVYADADVLVLPTVEEGSALVTYQAMAHGLPLLTTAMGAGEVVRDGREGILCEPYDHGSWVAAIQRMATDSELRARMGKAAQDRVAEFTWPKVSARRRDILLEAISRRLGNA